MKKITIYLLLVTLLISAFSFCVSANVNVSVNNRAVGVVDDAVYCISNQASGKYLNVHMGNDNDGTNIYQWTKDYSVEQMFKLVYDSSQAAYRIYAMCSSNGTDKVLSVNQSNNMVVSGCNVQLYSSGDNSAQLWYVTRQSNGKYVITAKSNMAVALTAYGSSNGTSSGTTATSAGNVFVSSYAGASNQMWTLEELASGDYDELGFQYMFASSYNNYRISSGYKMRTDHFGFDITNSAGDAATYGHIINNVYEGRVVMKSETSATAGKYIVVETNAIDPLTSKRIRVRYLHMSEISPDIALYSTVTTGQYIGKVGNTGQVYPTPHKNEECNSGNIGGSCQNPSYCATCGTHLHFDANYDGSLSATATNTVNPQRFFPNVPFFGNLSSYD